MPDINQFGSGGPGDQQTCARCEALLMDALDHTATPEDQAFFDRHLAGCISCSRMFMDAKRGAAWLEMLRDPRPEPPAALFQTILAQTTGALPLAHNAQTFPVSAPVLTPAALPANVLPFRPRTTPYTFAQRMLQPRLAMTAAMAFFSVALTLNLTGVHLTELRAADLRPANLRRDFHEANAHVVRYYDNLRVVYELEARVHELQRTTDAEPDSAPPQSNQPAPSKPEEDRKTPGKPGPGTSRREPLFPDTRSVAALETYPRTLQAEKQWKGDRS